MRELAKLLELSAKLSKNLFVIFSELENGLDCEVRIKVFYKLKLKLKRSRDLIVFKASLNFPKPASEI